MSTSGRVLSLPARDLIEMQPEDFERERLRQIGRCAFGIAYPGDTEAERRACDLKDRGLYCRTHNAYGRRD